MSNENGGVGDQPVSLAARGDMVDSPPTYESDHSYITLNAYYNESYYGRALPPVPAHCPTPLGDKGPKEYPDVDVLIKKVFLRREFIPEPHDTNILFQYYAQHFTHQFFRTDYEKGPQLTKGYGGVRITLKPLEIKLVIHEVVLHRLHHCCKTLV